MFLILENDNWDYINRFQYCKHLKTLKTSESHWKSRWATESIPTPFHKDEPHTPGRSQTGSPSKVASFRSRCGSACRGRSVCFKSWNHGMLSRILGDKEEKLPKMASRTNELDWCASITMPLTIHEALFINRPTTCSISSNAKVQIEHCHITSDQTW